MREAIEKRREEDDYTQLARERTTEPANGGTKEKGKTGRKGQAEAREGTRTVRRTRAEKKERKSAKDDSKHIEIIFYSAALAQTR